MEEGYAMQGIYLTSQQVDMLSLSGDLLLNTDHDIWPGMGLCIHTPTDTFWTEVVEVKRLENHYKHNWCVSVKCNRYDELRKALTYHVAGGKITDG